MIINLSRVDFGGVVTGGKSKPEEVFDVQPTTTDQTITPSEGSVFSGGTVRAVTSAIDNNIVPGNIKEGVSILGVAGTLSAGGGSDVFVVPPEMRFGYSKFTEFPSNWDFREFSNVTDMSYMFYSCKSLTTAPQLNTQNATTMESMFRNCSNLETVPSLNTSGVSIMFGMFQNCFNLVTIPPLDTSNVTSMGNMFYDCNKLTTVPSLDTSKVTSMNSMFSGCSFLSSVKGIDFSGLTKNLTNLFGNSSTRMTYLTRFIVNGKINVSISDGYSIYKLTKIDYDSVKSILAAADRTDNTNAKTLAFNRTMTDQNGELAALVSSCTSKGWTISGLTLQ